MEYRSLFVGIYAALVGGFGKGWADVAWLGRLMDGVCILRVKLLFLLRESEMVLPCSWFLPARLGPQPIRKAAVPPYGWGVPPAGKTTFSFACKRKSGSGLRKRKGRPVEILGWCGTTE